ncbi:MAG: N-acetylglutamate synthase-like GNAT family acetyltransferase [Roseivirga sp.]|jgi:N-acetylglutamate synthase-like GNAT family acetyltransferase
MKIRDAKNSDLEQLSALFDRYRIFYRNNSDIDTANNFLSERMKNGDSEIYVCETSENKLVGFVQLYPLFSSTKMKKCGY